ncbi:MAG: HlyD family efflux transporter periplasmic adaptor subunit [Flavobacteriaceae bacterium]|nr:HlyD family efflux transporter periplasmic adaptor subunit [Flavobacteriaceae bacterium]
MKTKHKILWSLSTLLLSITACKTDTDKADAYGNFEATEITVSSEINGKLLQFDVNEGDILKKDAFLGYIDTIQLSLKKELLVVSKDVIASKSRGVLSQITVLKSRLKTAERNKKRIENLIKDDAGTQKQLDDIVGEIDVIQQQIISIEIQNAPVVNELKNIDIQLKVIDDQILKSKIINPIDGTVIVKYSEAYEITTFGKPLYKIADLSKMELRVYISENQLSNLKIGQNITVKIDENKEMKSYQGTIIWIASEAEFTPKIIQTKEERVALVYAIKIVVINDGGLKIGMPAEMWIE